MARTPSDDPDSGLDWERRRIRLVFPGSPPYRHHERIPASSTKNAARARLVFLKELRAQGKRPAVAAAALTLGAVAAEVLARKRIAGDDGRPLTANGKAWWERSLRPWIQGPLASRPLEFVTLEDIEAWQLDRYAVAPTACFHEAGALLTVLRRARKRRLKFDHSILELDQIPPVPKDQVALELHELEWFAAHAPDYAAAMPLFQGTVGNRIGELFSAEVDEFQPKHLGGPVLFVPACKCKEGRDKWIPLTLEETELAAGQILRNPAGCRWLFPTKTGRQWTHSQFDRLVWQKTKTAAAKAWAAKHGADHPTVAKFQALTTHNLRATAITAMSDAGMPREACAYRVGHADGGKLIAEIYDRGIPERRARRALDLVAPRGLRANAEAAGSPAVPFGPAAPTGSDGTP